jgi:hypothetical protein
MRIIGCDLHASQQSLAMRLMAFAFRGGSFRRSCGRRCFGQTLILRTRAWPWLFTSRLTIYGAILTAKISHGRCGFQLRETN